MTSATQTPSVGQIVHYRLRAEEAADINRRRELGVKTIGGAFQYHVGKSVEGGDIMPMIITRAELDPEDNLSWLVSGQCFLDGNDSLWVPDTTEGEDNGQWFWPPRV